MLPSTFCDSNTFIRATGWRNHFNDATRLLALVDFAFLEPESLPDAWPMAPCFRLNKGAEIQERALLRFLELAKLSHLMLAAPTNEERT